jgi:hypothetical protein
MIRQSMPSGLTRGVSGLAIRSCAKHKSAAEGLIRPRLDA